MKVAIVNAQMVISYLIQREEVLYLESYYC